MKNMSRRRFFKRAARRMLFSDWTRQIVAFLVVFAFFIGVNYFGISASGVLYEIMENAAVSTFVISFLLFASFAFAIPLFYGLLGFEINAISGKKTELSSIFSAFSDFDIVMRSYVLFFRMLFQCIFGFLPAIALFCFKNYFYEGGMLGELTFAGIDVILFLINTLLILLLYLGIVLSANLFVGVYISIKREDMQVEECFYEAKKCIKGSRAELAKTALSFLPLFVVSLFTIGFLFVMYTIPYMVITLLMFSKYLYDKKNYLFNAERATIEQNEISE